MDRRIPAGAYPHEIGRRPPGLRALLVIPLVRALDAAEADVRGPRAIGGGFVCKIETDQASATTPNS